MMKNTNTKRDKTATKNNLIGDKIDMTYIPFRQMISQLAELIYKRDKLIKAESEFEQIRLQIHESYTNMKKEKLKNKLDKLIKAESEFEQIRSQIEETNTNKYEAQYANPVVNLMKAKYPVVYAAYMAMNRAEDELFYTLCEAYKGLKHFKS